MEKIEFETKQIDPEYDKVLSEFESWVPDVFFRQAREAARLITTLDLGILNTETRTLLDTVSGAGFVGTMRSRYSDVFKNSFPSWIIKEREKERVGSFQRFDDGVIAVYNHYVAENGTERHDPNGTYVDYKTGSIVSETSSDLMSFKGYVPNDITAEGLETLLKTLKIRNIHPKVTKLFSELNRLVLYWTTPPDQEMISTLEELKITGIGEDSFRIVNDFDGVTVRAAASRDKSLASGVVDFGQNEFDKSKFFRNYLTHCLHWWRDPSNPGWMSYVPSEVEIDKVPDQIKKDAKDMGLEIVYKPRNI